MVESGGPSAQALVDRNLVLQVVDGNHKAFQELMDRYYDAIFFTMLKMVNDKHFAEDLTLEVFGKAYTGINQYNMQYAFSTWLFRIATNHGIDFLRRNRQRTMSIDEDTGQHEASGVLLDEKPGPEEELIQLQNASELADMMKKLKPFWKKLLEMRYFDELSYEEIAEQLNMSMGTVKNQLFRAKEQLSKIYFEKNKKA
jgi:RNA polymerase sigma factor (sigma-70 family)